MRLTSYFKASLKVAAIIFAATLFASAGKADVTYTYTGHLFTGFTGGAACPTECQIAGSFTVTNPLPVSSSGYLFGSTLPTSFSFTDGAFTFNNTNTTSSDFGFITDPTGKLIGWNMDWFIGTLAMFTSTGPSAICTAGCSVTDIRNGDGSSAFNTNTPGTWSIPGGPTGVPEPSTMLLLAAGLAALALRSIVKAGA